MELTHVIQLAIGVFTAGAAWGAARMGIRHVELSLKQHMRDTRDWREDMGRRLGSVERFIRHSRI